jgi:hypothetical protein
MTCGAAGVVVVMGAAVVRGAAGLRERAGLREGDGGPAAWLPFAGGDAAGAVVHAVTVTPVTARAPASRQITLTYIRMRHTR